MKGTIREINQIRGMVAVLTEEGNFSIFELLGGDIVEVGDEVQWKNDTGLGSEILTNLSRSESYEVYFQNHHVQKSQLRQQLLY